MPPCVLSKQEETCIQNLYPQQAVAQGILSSGNGKLGTPAQGDLEQDKMFLEYFLKRVKELRRKQGSSCQGQRREETNEVGRVHH